MEPSLIRERVIYEEWMKKEGIPIYEGVAGVEDITELPRRPWARLGGYGTFIELDGTKQTETLLYVVEIPAGKALEPEKHLYDEIIYILRGKGLSEVWQEGGSKRSFEWREGSLFGMPTNAWHRLVNGGQEPVLFLAKTNTPVVMNNFRDPEFIFNCDYKFIDRYTGQADYFQPNTEKRYTDYGRSGWYTNFVPDVRTTFLAEKSGAMGKGIHFRMATWDWLHADTCPVGKYERSHYHSPGAVLLALNSTGYVLLWPWQYGIHPFQDGHGDKVVKFNWKVNSIFCSSAGPGEWFHQTQFNTGRELGRRLVLSRHLDNKSKSHGQSIREKGGTHIEYEDEDPEIRRMFEGELRRKGIECAMPPVVYRNDPFSMIERGHSQSEQS